MFHTIAEQVATTTDRMLDTHSVDTTHAAAAYLLPELLALRVLPEEMGHEFVNCCFPLGPEGIVCDMVNMLPVNASEESMVCS